MPHNYYRKGEEHQVEREQTPGWRIIVRWVPPPAWILGGLVLLLALIIVGYRYQITLWDWLKLLIVPAVLAGGGIWFNKQQRERELEIADQRTQDEALQAYLDQMSHLLTDKELRRTTDWLDEARITARARSLAALSRLDGERKRSVLQFLYEAQLINRRESTFVEGVTYELGPARIVGLSGADLRSADLRYIYLSEAALNGALLDNADLREAKLRDIDLGGAYLSGADLRGADLRGASLINAELQRKDELNLSGADLSGADLSGADLSGADLSGADLSGADLRGARGLTQEQIDLTIGSNKAELPEGLNRPQ
jgi:uncharacterized protein YjbI with pentapeptide repeats